MKWFKRPQIAIIIGCLNIITYCMFAAVLLDNLKFDRFSHYDYDDYRDVYTSYELRQQARVRREIYCTIYVIACIIMVFLSMLLIWGVTKRRPVCITPWLLASFVVLIYSSIIVLDDIFLKSSFEGVANAVIFFVTLFIIFGFQAFCLAVVHSVYKSFELEIVLRRFNVQTNDMSESREQEENIPDGEQQQELNIKHTNNKTKSKKNEIKKWK